MAKKLNRKKSFGTIINCEIPGAVFIQDGLYFDSHDRECGEAPKPVQKTAVSKAKETEARNETLARATAILGDLGAAPSPVDVQREAQKENIAAEQAESLTDNV